MADAVLLTIASVVVVSLVSLVGVSVLAMKISRLKKITLYLVGLAAGTMFGDAFLHLLPEAAAAGFTTSVALYALGGVVVFFAVEKIVHWHHCHNPEAHAHSFAYMNLIGDGVHNFLDGLIVAAAYVASIPVGVATTFAVILHEIPQEISDFGVLIHGGFSAKKALALNFLSAVLAVVGAAVGIVIISTVETALIPLLAFAAGGFIYIAGVDLIPELHKGKELRASVLQLVVFLLGAAAMYALLFVE